jgi:hypothetical protein
MRQELQDFYNIVAGRKVFVIGGGPSLKEIDISILDDKLTVGINAAYKILKNPTALYWCDESYASSVYEDISKIKCFKFSGKHSADGFIKDNIKTIGGATVLKRTGDFGIDPDVDHVRGNNSGAHVINLLANMKVSDIILLGFDGKLLNNKAHWHDGYGLPMNNFIYSDLFIPSICSMAVPLKNMGINVLNLSDRSAIDCFPKQNSMEYFREN